MPNGPGWELAAVTWNPPRHPTQTLGKLHGQRAAAAVARICQVVGVLVL